MSAGPIPHVDLIVKAMIQARWAIPIIMDTIVWLRDVLARAGEPVPSTDELADMIDATAAGNAAFNLSEIDRLEVKKRLQGAE